MPYKVIKDLESDVESEGKTRAAMAKEIADLSANVPAGQPVIGRIGPPLPEELSEVLPNYTPDEINERTALQNLLKRYLVPPVLGAKFTEKQAQRRFIMKVEKQSLADLRRFYDKPISDSGEISIEEQAELQQRWEELSP